MAPERQGPFNRSIINQSTPLNNKRGALKSSKDKTETRCGGEGENPDSNPDGAAAPLPGRPRLDSLPPLRRVCAQPSRNRCCCRRPPALRFPALSAAAATAAAAVLLNPFSRASRDPPQFDTLNTTRPASLKGATAPLPKGRLGGRPGPHSRCRRFYLLGRGGESGGEVFGFAWGEPAIAERPGALSSTCQVSKDES